MHGLIIREPWIGFILSGEKTWELRTTQAPRRGRIGLIRKGTGMVVGVADIIDSLPKLDAVSLPATRIQHRVPPDLDATVLKAGWLHPWVLGNIRNLSRPIVAEQRPGQVIWVPLSPSVVRLIDEDFGSTTLTSATSAAHKTVIGNAMHPATTAAASGRHEVRVRLTKGAIGNANLSVRSLLCFLPSSVIGGTSHSCPAPERLTVIFSPGATVETDVPVDKKTLHCRGEVADFYARSGAVAGDDVRIRISGLSTLHVELVR